MREPVPEGLSDFDLELGALRVRLENFPTPMEPFVTEHFEPFVTRARGNVVRPDIVVRCKEAQGLVLPLDQDGGPTRVDVERETATRWRVRSHWQDGSFDLKRGTGEVILTERTWDKFAMSVENFLRVMLQAAAFARESFLLHAAPIIDGDRAVLLAGPSGAGKSTAAAYALPRPALSDDLALIDLSREEPRVITVPLYQADPPGQRLRGSFPIAALVRLRQAPEDEVVPMSAARAVATASALVPFARDLGYDAERLVTLTAGLAAHVPAFEARVTKSARLWELLPPLLAAKR